MKAKQATAPRELAQESNLVMAGLAPSQLTVRKKWKLLYELHDEMKPNGATDAAIIEEYETRNKNLLGYERPDSIVLQSYRRRLRLHARQSAN